MGSQVWINTFEYNVSTKTAKNTLKSSNYPQFARNRRILQETNQDLPGASPIARSQRRTALLHVNVLYSKRHLFMSKAGDEAANRTVERLVVISVSSVTRLYLNICSRLNNITRLKFQGPNVFCFVSTKWILMTMTCLFLYTLYKKTENSFQIRYLWKFHNLALLDTKGCVKFIMLGMSNCVPETNNKILTLFVVWLAELFIIKLLWKFKMLLIAQLNS